MNVARRTCGYIGTQFGNQAELRKLRKGYCTYNQNWPIDNDSRTGGLLTNYGEIKFNDIANGAVCAHLFVSGCASLQNCFNEQTWTAGQPFTEETMEKFLIPAIMIDKRLCHSGRWAVWAWTIKECFCRFLSRLKSAFPDKTIWRLMGLRFRRKLWVSVLIQERLRKRLKCCRL